MRDRPLEPGEHAAMLTFVSADERMDLALSDGETMEVTYLDEDYCPVTLKATIAAPAELYGFDQTGVDALREIAEHVAEDADLAPDGDAVYTWPEDW